MSEESNVHFEVCKDHESRGHHYAACWFLHSCMVC